MFNEILSEQNVIVFHANTEKQLKSEIAKKILYLKNEYNVLYLPIFPLWGKTDKIFLQNKSDYKSIRSKVMSCKIFALEEDNDFLTFRGEIKYLKDEKDILLPFYILGAEKISSSNKNIASKEVIKHQSFIDCHSFRIGRCNFTNFEYFLYDDVWVKVKE